MEIRSGIAKRSTGPGNQRGTGEAHCPFEQKGKIFAAPVQLTLRKKSMWRKEIRESVTKVSALELREYWDPGHSKALC